MERISILAEDSSIAVYLYSEEALKVLTGAFESSEGVRSKSLKGLTFE